MNMPVPVRQYMLLDTSSNSNVTLSASQQLYHDQNTSLNGTLDFESTLSLAVMAVSHVVDLLAHPLLTYYFWRQYNEHKNSKKKKKDDEDDDDDTIFTWSVILSAYLFSRIWSLLHAYYNFGFFAWFYVGFDVYVIDDLDMWYPAYAMETLVFGSVVTWKLATRSSTPKPKSR